MRWRFFMVIVDLMITLAVYLVFPLIYVKVHGKVERKKAKKLAIRNSVLCCVLFFVFRAIVSGGAEVYFSVPVAFFYYFINKKILEDR